MREYSMHCGTLCSICPTDGCIDAMDSREEPNSNQKERRKERKHHGTMENNNHR